MLKSCPHHFYAPDSIPKRQRSLYRCTFLRSSAFSLSMQRRARIMICWVNSSSLNVKNSTVCAWSLFRSLFHSPHISSVLVLHVRKWLNQCRPHISAHITVVCCDRIIWKHFSCELITVTWSFRAEKTMTSIRRFKHCMPSLSRKWMFFMMKHFSITWQSIQHGSCGSFHILTMINSWSWKRPVSTMWKWPAEAYRARATWSSPGGLSLACQQTGMWRCSWQRNQVWGWLAALNETSSDSEWCWLSQICAKKPTEVSSRISSISCWGQEWNSWLISIRRWWSGGSKMIVRTSPQLSL